MLSDNFNPYGPDAEIHSMLRRQLQGNGFDWSQMSKLDIVTRNVNRRKAERERIGL